MSEKNMEEKLLKISSKLENFINTEKYEADLNKIKHTENKLSKKMSQLEKHIWDELEKMQDEYQSGEQIPLTESRTSALSYPVLQGLLLWANGQGGILSLV